MQVTNKKMYHLHKTNVYNDMWVSGKEFTIDDNFDTFFARILKYYNVAVDVTGGYRRSFDNIIEGYLKEKQKKETLIMLLNEAQDIIRNSKVFLREKALEEVREKYFPNLPSRTHSIWVTNKKGVDFWKTQLVNENCSYQLILFEVSLTGNLFKTSDYLLPETEMDYEDALKRAHQYWNPDFTQIKKDRNEYLFQGNVKIMKKLEKITNSD